MMDFYLDVCKQHLCCSICMERYVEPKQLPCLHSFCRRCLTNHILRTINDGSGGSFQCPVCRKVFMHGVSSPTARGILEWVESFPDNFYINGLIATFERRAEASGYAVGRSRLSLQRETCLVHKKNVVFYCVSQKIGICGECIKEERHKNCLHNHLWLEEARDMADKRLVDFKNRLKLLTLRVEGIDDSLNDRIETLNLRKNELAIELSEYFSEMRNKVNRILLWKEREAANELKKVVGKEHTRLSASVDEAKALSGSLKGTDKLFDKLIENRPVGALSVADTVEKQIASYDEAVSKLEAVCAEVDVKLCKNGQFLKTMNNVNWGSFRRTDDVSERIGASSTTSEVLQESRHTQTDSGELHYDFNKGPRKHVPKETCKVQYKASAIHETRTKREERLGASSAPSSKTRERFTEDMFCDPLAAPVSITDLGEQAIPEQTQQVSRLTTFVPEHSPSLNAGNSFDNIATSVATDATMLPECSNESQGIAQAVTEVDSEELAGQDQPVRHQSTSDELASIFGFLSDLSAEMEDDSFPTTSSTPIRERVQNELADDSSSDEPVQLSANPLVEHLSSSWMFLSRSPESDTSVDVRHHDPVRPGVDKTPVDSAEVQTQETEV